MPLFACNFAVSDSGIGIAPENQARIFTGFSQAEASTTRKFGGTGLGLAISKRMIEIMGGELNLDSEIGQGSVFSFTLELPLVAEVPEEIDDAIPFEHHKHAGRWLLTTMRWHVS